MCTKILREISECVRAGTYARHDSTGKTFNIISKKLQLPPSLEEYLSRILTALCLLPFASLLSLRQAPYYSVSFSSTPPLS